MPDRWSNNVRLWCNCIDQLFQVLGQYLCCAYCTPAADPWYCHDVQQYLAPKAICDMQGTYQYWGSRFFSLLYAGIDNVYAFQMQVDDAARLWINNVLVIDATCKRLAHSKSIYSANISSSFGSTTRHADDLTSPVSWQQQAFYTCSQSAGTLHDNQSSSNSSYLWNGTIFLAKGEYNITIEYHNGKGAGALTLGGNYNTSAGRPVSAH